MMQLIWNIFRNADATKQLWQGIYVSASGNHTNGCGFEKKKNGVEQISSITKIFEELMANTNIKFENVLDASFI